MFLWLVHTMDRLKTQFAWLKLMVGKGGGVGECFLSHLFTSISLPLSKTSTSGRGRFQGGGKISLPGDKSSSPWPRQWPWLGVWSRAPLVSPPRHYLEWWRRETSFDVEDTQRKAKAKGKSAMRIAPLTLDKPWLGLLAPPHCHGLSISSKGQRGLSF